jgi:hypothetical protein
LQVCAACPTVLFASVCCLPNCIICKCVLPAQLCYLQVCAACPTVLFASVCCLPNCVICKCVLPAQRPILFRKVQTPSIPETPMIRSLPALGRIQQYQLYILTLEFQPEDGSSCTSRNIKLEDIIKNTFQ